MCVGFYSCDIYVLVERAIEVSNPQFSGHCGGTLSGLLH